MSHRTSLRFLPIIALLALGLSACDSTDPDMSEPELVPMLDLLADSTALSDRVTLNPSGRTPLAAHMSIDTAVPTSVDLTVLGDEPLEQSFESVAVTHSFPIVGLYPGRTNQVLVRLNDPADDRYAVDTLIIDTPALPESFPDIEIESADPSRMAEGWNLSSLSLADNGNFASYPVIFDTDGVVRWYLDLSEFGRINFLLRRLNNGNFGFGIARSIFEYDLLGNEIDELTFPDYWYHHDFVEKPDGNFIVAVDKNGIGTVEDHVIEIDRVSGSIVREWDLRQILDIDRFDLLENPQDWFHMNAVWYVPEDDALIISGRNQGVVKVDGHNNLVWILAPHQGWGAAGLEGQGLETSDFLLTAVGADGSPLPNDVQQGTAASAEFDWAWGQHAPMTLENGNLFLFDNGFNRNFGSAPNFSRGVEYEIDESAMTIRQVWEYGEVRGADYFSAIISDVDVQPENGNRIIMPGFIDTGASTHAYLTEVTHPGGMVVFDARMDFSVANGSGDGWGEIDIVYRSDRLLMYPDILTSTDTTRPEDADAGKAVRRLPVRMDGRTL